jgi:hypothetical protein
MLGSLNTLTVGQNELVQPDRVSEPPGGAVRGRELVPGSERVGMLSPVDPLAVVGDPFKYRDRAVGLVRGQHGLTQVAPGGDGAGMIRSEDPDALSQHRPEAGDGLRRLPGREIRAGQLRAGRQGSWVSPPEDLVAHGGDLFPVLDRGAGQPGGGQAQADARQQRMAAVCPQQVPGGPPQAGRG